MLIKTPVPHSTLEINTNNSFSKERLKSRSKLDKRIYKINNLKNNSPYIKSDYNTIDIDSKRRKIIYSPIHSKNQNNILLNDKMSFIPNAERKKAESNFIKLINGLINSKKTNNDNYSYKRIFNENKKNIPYKPSGYKYYEYIREHPVIINDDDDNIYSKVINDIQSDKEIDNNYDKELNKSYKSFNKLTKNQYALNTSSLEEKNIIKLKPIIKKNYEESNTISIDNDKLSEDSKSDRLDLKSIDCNDITKSNNIFPKINIKIHNTNHKNNNQKDYKKSDIFYLINDKLSKDKSSEKYLFKRNYFPKLLENEKKTSINEVGWSPKGHNNRSRIGCSSVAFNILSPSLKSFAQMKKDIDLQNRNNFDKPHLMSEYIEMCNPGDSNLRDEFKDKFNKDQNIFHKKNYCAAYNDLHHEYKDLVNNVF